MIKFYSLGACPRIESLLQKSWICAISRFFSSNSRAILLKKAKNRPKPNFPSSRFLFSNKLLVFLLLSISLNTSAQSFDKDKMNALFDHIESNNQGIMSIAISYDNKEVYHRSIGYASIADNIKASNKTKYRIGSISKTFTATLIMQLVEQEKLSLTTKLSKFFPTIKNADKITIENLLQHRSGIFNITSDESFLKWMLKETNQKQMVERIAQYEPQFKPNAKMSYSNSNYILLSYIAEKVSGQSYTDLLKNNIAKSCHLHDTYYGGKINPQNNEAYS